MYLSIKKAKKKELIAKIENFVCDKCHKKNFTLHQHNNNVEKLFICCNNCKEDYVIIIQKGFKK